MIKNEKINYSLWITKIWKREVDGRYYRIQISQNIWGSWLFTTSNWGKIRQKENIIEVELESDYEKALHMLAEASLVRKKKGYCCIGGIF